LYPVYHEQFCTFHHSFRKYLITRRIRIKPPIRVAGAGPAARNVSMSDGEAGKSEIVICFARPSTTVIVCSEVTYPSFTTVSVWFPTVMLGSETGVTPDEQHRAGSGPLRDLMLWQANRLTG
jgi:hypothetical protein